jgi:hypothetical protein
VRLTPEQVAEEKKYLSELKERVWIERTIRELQLYIDVRWGGTNDILNLALTALKDFCKLQQENEQLQAKLDEWKYEAKCHMDEVIAREKQIEQLRAQAARMRDALIIANHRMPDVGQFCACGKCKTCGADINYAGYEHCVKCARAIIDAALSDTPADYHNPADVEVLEKAREAIKAAWSDGSANAAIDKASEALAAIDKVIGGGGI